MKQSKLQWPFKKLVKRIPDFFNFVVPVSFLMGGLAWNITGDQNFGWFVCVVGILSMGFMSYTNKKYLG